MKIIELFVKAINWLKIAISPALLGFVIALIVYVNYYNTVGFVLACTITVLGCIAGIVFANRVSKKTGVIEFNARIYESPDFDNIDKQKQ